MTAVVAPSVTPAGWWVAVECTRCGDLLAPIVEPRVSKWEAKVVLRCTSCRKEHLFAARLDPLTDPTGNRNP